MKHLKERQDYIDQYDKFTVEECRRIESLVSAKDVERIAKKQKTKDKINHEGMAKYVNQLHLWCAQGERYRKKDETLLKSGWIVTGRWMIATSERPLRTSRA